MLETIPTAQTYDPIKRADKALRDELIGRTVSKMKFKRPPERTDDAKLGQKIARKRRRVEKITNFYFYEENPILKKIKLLFIRKLMNDLINSGQETNHKPEDIEGARIFIEKSIEDTESWEMANTVLEVFPEILPKIAKKIIAHIPQEKSAEYPSFIKNPGAEKIINMMISIISRVIEDQTIEKSEEEEETLTALKAKLEVYFSDETI